MEIPGYEVIDTLGEGSLATVYLAVGELSERELALKLVKPEICSDPAFSASFLHRARLLSELKHPNIVEVFDTGHAGLSCYLAMAYIAGRTLRHRRFELSLREQLAVVKDVASALDYARHQSCDHGRLTPDNIMLRDHDHRVVVTDFVMGKAPLAAVEGCYVSPERRQGLEGDHRSDIYSLGAILLLLLGVRVPREAPESGDQAKKVNLAEAGAGEGMAPELVGGSLPEGLSVFRPIIERAMALSPEDRYQSGAELVSALNKITETQLEAGARAQALELLNRGEGDSSPKASSSAEQNSSEPPLPKNPAPFSEATEPEAMPERESSLEAENSPDETGAKEEPQETCSELSDVEYQTGVLRVWEQDRIDRPLESERPSWWIICICALAALGLVGAVILAAVMD